MITIKHLLQYDSKLFFVPGRVEQSRRAAEAARFEMNVITKEIKYRFNLDNFLV